MNKSQKGFLILNGVSGEYFSAAELFPIIKATNDNDFEKSTVQN